MTLLAGVGVTPVDSRTAQSVAPSPGPAGGSRSDEPCRTNFTVRGSRLSGFTLKTFDEFPDVAPNRAFQDVAKAMAADGGILQNANEKLGTVSALGALGPDSGTHPVNAVVAAAHRGSRVDLSWSVGAFIMFHRTDVESHFCKWLNRISHGG